jgi:feruloyl-CoA synthase
VSPTLYLNVPRGFDLLLPYLESDAQLRKNFFRDLDLIFYAGAALPQNLWERIEKLVLAERGGELAMLSGWGSTETAPMATCVHYPIERAGRDRAARARLRDQARALGRQARGARTRPQRHARLLQAR